MLPERRGGCQGRPMSKASSCLPPSSCLVPSCFILRSSRGVPVAPMSPSKPCLPPLPGIQQLARQTLDESVAAGRVERTPTLPCLLEVVLLEDDLLEQEESGAGKGLQHHSVVA